MAEEIQKDDDTLDITLTSALEVLESYTYRAEKRSLDASIEDDMSPDSGDEHLNVSASPIVSPTVRHKATVKHKSVKYEHIRTPKKRAATSPVAQSQPQPTRATTPPPIIPGQDQPLPSSTETSPSHSSSQPPSTAANSTLVTKQPELDFLLNDPTWYTVSATTLAYCLDPAGPPPLDWERTRSRWLMDCWSHLVDPDPSLTIKHFILALPEDMDHEEAWIKIRRANQNLELARWRPSSWTSASWKEANQKPFTFPPQINMERPAAMTHHSDLSTLIQQIATLQAHLAEGQELMVSAINKFTAVAEGSIRDTSQCMRSMFDGSITKLQSIADGASTMAIPLASTSAATTPRSRSGTASTPTVISTPAASNVAPPKPRKKPGKSKPLQ